MSRSASQVACALVRRGLSVIPTGGGSSPRAKQPHFEALKATGHHSTDPSGKTRATWKAMQQRLPTERELATWFLTARARGLGLVTGAISKLIVIDVDAAGLPLLAELGWLAHVHTPGGGAHLYVRHPGWPVASNASKIKASLPPGFDVRGDGGYVMFPPSRTHKGTYRRTDERQPLSIQAIPETVTVEGQMYHLRSVLGLAEPPEPERVTGSPQRAERTEMDDERCPVWLMLEKAAEYAPESRNKGAFLFGLYMNANGYSLSEALAYTAEYVAMVQGVKASVFDPSEAQGSIQSAYRYPAKEPWKRVEPLYTAAR